MHANYVLFVRFYDSYFTLFLLQMISFRKTVYNRILRFFNNFTSLHNNKNIRSAFDILFSSSFHRIFQNFEKQPQTKKGILEKYIFWGKLFHFCFTRCDINNQTLKSYKFYLFILRGILKTKIEYVFFSKTSSPRNSVSTFVPVFFAHILSSVDNSGGATITTIHTFFQNNNWVVRYISIFNSYVFIHDS